MVQQTPWAVLLCKFRDDQSDPPVPDFRTICDRFFTHPAGYNAFQFFSDMSHGNIDLVGSDVLGWFTIDATQSDALPQSTLMELARQAAINAGVDINRFFGTVLIMNLMTGWAQGGAGAVGAVWADWRRIDGRNPDGTLGGRGTGGGNGTEIFGQEMGHAYGLNHSRREGSDEEYQDFWDIMSTCASSAGSCPTYTAVDQDYCARGPGINAWNMRSRAWLDESRVWRIRDRYENFDGSVQLRPLHRRDLPGNLAAEIPAVDDASSNYLLEFRLKSGWDEGIPRSAVLVHEFEDGHSVILRDTSGQYDLANGAAFQRLPHINARVTSIDEANQTAILRIVYRAPENPECTTLKDRIAALDMEIEELQREYDMEEDLSRKQRLQQQLREKRFQRSQLSRRFTDLGCGSL